MAHFGNTACLGGRGAPDTRPPSGAARGRATRTGINRLNLRTFMHVP